MTAQYIAMTIVTVGLIYVGYEICRLKNQKGLVMEKENIVKQVCSELGITQKELSERIGMSADSLNVAVSASKLSKQTIAAVKLVAENEKLKRELAKLDTLKAVLKDIMS